MSDFHKLLEDFSSSGRPVNIEFLDTLSSLYVQNILKRFISNYKYEISLHSAGLEEFIESCANKLTHKKSWDKSFGLIKDAVVGKSVNPVSSLSEFSLFLISGGFRGQWAAKMEKPENLFFQNIVLKNVSQIEVNSDGKELEIVFRKHRNKRFQKIELAYEQNLWRCESNDRIEFLPAVEIGDSLITGIYTQPDCEKRKSEKESLGFTLDVIKQALEFLRIYSVNQYNWIINVIKHIVHLESDDKSLILSASSKNKPGVAHFSIPPNKMAMMEMLIHEASHHYFYIVNRLGDVSNNIGQFTYYSPVVKKQRTIDKVILAFHAFANVLLLYDVIINNNLDEDKFCEHYYDKVRNEVIMLTEHINVDPTINDIGKCLTRPLIECLQLS